MRLGSGDRYRASATVVHGREVARLPGTVIRGEGRYGMVVTR